MKNPWDSTVKKCTNYKALFGNDITVVYCSKILKVINIYVPWKIDNFTYKMIKHFLDMISHLLIGEYIMYLIRLVRHCSRNCSSSWHDPKWTVSWEIAHFSTEWLLNVYFLCGHLGFLYLKFGKFAFKGMKFFLCI
jgi:hypothetical protein